MIAELTPDKEPFELDAVVVGASWAGIWALHLLQSQGLKVKLIDACADVGGVWHYTHYPGCRVDTEVPFYEFSKPELWQEWKWSERFPCRAEIQQYLGWVCDKLDLRKNIIQNTRVTGAHWNETRHVWKIYSEDQLLASAQFFLPCSGYSTIRYIPDFPGKNEFKNSYHSSKWPASLDYKGKRVAIIGTAASGIQCIENMAGDVAELVVFQRTPNLATPMQQEHFTEDRRRELKEKYPELFKSRISRNGFGREPPLSKVQRKKNTFDDDPVQRRETYEGLYARGGLAFWFDNYNDMLTNADANKEAYAFWREKACARIKNPDIAKILAPVHAPHAFGTKRPSLETAYFEVYNRPNVKLVDVNKDPIDHITSTGIHTKACFHELDIIIYSTGFDFITGSMLAMGIHGTNERLLNEKWDVNAGGAGVFTHLGLMTAGYPNMFFPMGPQAPSALGLTPHMAEIQGSWISACIEHMRKADKQVIEPTEAAEATWKAEVNEAAEESLLGATDSWYMGVNIPGRKKEALCYFGGVDKYINFLDQSVAAGYPGFEFR